MAYTERFIEALTGVYKNMRLGVVALVFRCRPAGGTLTENSEAAGFRWIQESEASAIMPEAFAIRILDAYRNDAEPSIRDHDGVKLITPTR
jgi:8-oxo-dGTP diphosphatase